MFTPYKYTKAEKVEKIPKAKRSWPKLSVNLDGVKQWGSVILMASGMFLLGQQIVWPLLTTPRAQKPLLKPISLEPVVAGSQAEKSEGVKVEFEFEFTELRHQPESSSERPKVGTVPNNPLPTVFYVSVPKLGIERAEVETNSSNLSPDERLGHYAGSALPGDVGNTFIYGHSASPMFFDPKNYKTIFTTLDRLKEGDEVTVEFGEKYFKYVVEKSVVLNPEDVKPLEPVAPEFLRQSYLTLMTCVPPGIRTQRLLVQAKIVL